MCVRMYRLGGALLDRLKPPGQAAQSPAEPAVPPKCQPQTKPEERVKPGHYNPVVDYHVNPRRIESFG